MKSHVYTNNATGQTVILSDSQRNTKINEYNNAYSNYEQKHNELNNIINEYNNLLSRKADLPSEINDLNSEISDLSDQLNSLESELNFAKEYVDSVDNGEESAIENAVTGDGDDTIIGNALDNKIDGGRGDDTLTGNAGNDIFIIRKHGNETDTITDFKPGEDKIDLTAFGEDISFDDLVISQTGLNSEVTLQMDKR